MRTTLHRIITLIAGMLFVLHLWGQTGISAYDSVVIIKPKDYKNLYKFSDGGPKEIQFINKNPKLVKSRPNSGLRDFGNGTMTVLTGFGFNSETDGYWEVEGTIKCNDTLPDWGVKLYCEGYQTKDRERVRNDDGSWSVDTKETNFYYWDKNANGLLLEGTDTIGLFIISMNPREDTLLKPLSDNIFEQGTPQNFNSKNHRFFRGMPSPYIEYATYGKFRGKDLVMIRNSTDHKVWIYMDNLLTGMFQSDLKNSAVNKKNSQLSYLFINRNILSPDRRDQLRLAILSRFLLNSFLLK